MKHYVYIIQSELDNSYYKGYSLNPIKRLEEHNLGGSTYTSNKIPWKLIYVEEFENKTEALIRERSLKKYSRKQINDLIKTDRS